jgi:hypothetical protein
MTTDDRLTAIESKIDHLTEQVTRHHAWLTLLGGIGSLIVPAIVAAIVSSFGGCGHQ